MLFVISMEINRSCYFWNNLCRIVKIMPGFFQVQKWTEGRLDVESSKDSIMSVFSHSSNHCSWKAQLYEHPTISSAMESLSLCGQVFHFYYVKLHPEAESDMPEGIKGSLPQRRVKDSFSKCTGFCAQHWTIIPSLTFEGRKPPWT